MTNANIEPELNSLRAKLAVEIENDSKQVEYLKKRIEKNATLLAAVRGSLSLTTADGTATGYGAKSETIQNAIRALKGQFTQDDVEAEIRRINPEMEINRNRIRAALWTLRTKYEKINVIRKGTSLQPAVYEKTDEMALPPSGTITAAQFEHAVGKKTGRVDDLAKRFNTNAEAIKKLLKPASKVYVGTAGWLHVE